MNIQPLGDRVVLEQVELEEKTAAGIILPDSAKEKPSEGKVLAVGTEVKEVKAGDRVLYSKYGPTEVKVDGKELMIVKEEDILAVMKGGK
ncbi:co-chaperone GroES [Candidatus Saccharibacteria bacterium]|nr:co-chaperone GroES [Candidatus Saccharibacteria bacterium]